MINFYFLLIVVDQSCYLAKIKRVYRYVTYKAAAPKDQILFKSAFQNKSQNSWNYLNFLCKQENEYLSLKK